ncbi:MAG: peptidylprolyl isomerase [Bacteroidia bacterium]|nr:peptidylprolyl isomerase [Bacteroidia bacterium]
MKKLFYSLILFVFVASCSSNKETQAVISTKFGDIIVVLYNETPNHRDNFIKLVKDGFYDDLLFHRVMNQFMVQGGDPNSKGAGPGVRLGGGGPGYTLPHEMGFPHFRGALAAARQPDNVNPQKNSSGSQFYIVHGKKSSDQELNNMERTLGITYTPEQRTIYREVGGAPFLDMNYTVFGEVVTGMEVVDQIALVQVDPANRPLEDIKMSIRLK